MSQTLGPEIAGAATESQGSVGGDAMQTDQLDGSDGEEDIFKVVRWDAVFKTPRKRKTKVKSKGEKIRK